MGLKKIKENFYEELGMNKYDFFEKVADYIGNFPIIIDGFYFDNTSVGDGEYLYASINNVSYEIDTVSKEVKKENSGCIYVFYSEENEIEVYYEYEELLLYFITYYLKNIHCYIIYIYYFLFYCNYLFFHMYQNLLLNLISIHYIHYLNIHYILHM